MLSHEENEILTRVGPGTPCGELLRRYWQPICVASELTEDRPKKRVKMLDEELVVFRDSNGGFGLIGEHCAHRGTSVYYGFIEEGGIRCPYHGWLYDKQGHCVEQPFEPAQSLMKYAIQHPAYPVEKLGGLLFGYMGPPDKRPTLPRWDVLVWEDGHRTIRLQETLNCSWLQAQENSADVTHTYFLHARMLASMGLKGGDYYDRPFEEFGFQPFEYGLIKTWRYADDPRMGPEIGGGNPLVFPNMLRQQSGNWHNMHWRVPMDDTHTQLFVVNFTRHPDGHVEQGEPSVDFTGAQVLPSGDYSMDSFFTQDKMAWETQGPLFDRTHERLGASDRGIAMFREMLLEQIAAVKEGRDPSGMVPGTEADQVIELPGWFVTDGEVTRISRGTTPKDVVTAAGLLDERFEAFEPSQTHH